jgi:hypothetical protein
MNMHRRSRSAPSAFLRIVILVSLIYGLSAVSVQPAAAECSSWPVWTSFREVAPTSRRIVIGVVEKTPQGGGQPFTLDVEEVLRGRAPARMRIKGVESGVPPRMRDACAGYLYARFGDRIAIAFDGRSVSVKGRVTTAAWIEGQPFPSTMYGAETLSIEEVYAAAGASPDPAWAIGDAEAASACTEQLEAGIPNVETRSGEPSLAAAYRLTGAQWSDYVSMLDPGEVSIVEELDALRAVDAFDVCAFDGDLVVTETAGEDEAAVRVLVSIGPDGPSLAFIAEDRTDEVPIRFDLLR